MSRAPLTPLTHAQVRLAEPNNNNQQVASEQDVELGGMGGGIGSGRAQAPTEKGQVGGCGQGLSWQTQMRAAAPYLPPQPQPAPAHCPRLTAWQWQGACQGQAPIAPIHPRAHAERGHACAMDAPASRNARMYARTPTQHTQAMRGFFANVEAIKADMAEIRSLQREVLEMHERGKTIVKSKDMERHREAMQVRVTCFARMEGAVAAAAKGAGVFQGRRAAAAAKVASSATEVSERLCRPPRPGGTVCVPVVRVDGGFECHRGAEGNGRHTAFTPLHFPSARQTHVLGTWTCAGRHQRDQHNRQEDQGQDGDAGQGQRARQAAQGPGAGLRMACAWSRGGLGGVAQARRGVVRCWAWLGMYPPGGAHEGRKGVLLPVGVSAPRARCSRVAFLDTHDEHGVAGVCACVQLPRPFSLCSCCSHPEA